MYLFWNYIKTKKGNIAVFLLCCGIFCLIFYLYHLPLMAIGYAALLSGIGCLAFLIWDYIRFRKKHHILKQIQQELSITLEHLPEACTPLEEDYQILLHDLFHKRQHLEQDWQGRYGEMMEYYTAWVHQIKTPIAAMRLHLQAEDTPQSRALLEDLQRVEQYVEMVLCYLRLDSDSTDYLFAEYDLDKIVHQAIRRFSSQFITRKIRLEYEPLHCSVLTDEKWLLFVLEQVLSNGLKYTPSGGTITIFLEQPEILCIQDTGIGIEPADLPRIFEKGYTGYNGRTDKKASGIGLYLCRRICRNLNHTITISSQVDVGTVVRLDLHRERMEME